MKQDRNHSFPALLSRWSGLFLVTAGLLVSVGPVCAQRPAQPMSTNDMLEYTIAELRTRMQEIGQENNSLSKKISAIEKRILTLRQEQRRLENEKIRRLEDGLAQRDDLQLDDQEGEVLKKKISNLNMKQELLVRENQGLKESLAAQQALQKDVQARVGKLQDAVRSYQARIKEAREPKETEFLRPGSSLSGQKMTQDEKFYLSKRDVNRLKDRIGDLKSRVLEAEREKYVLKTRLAKAKKSTRLIRSAAQEQPSAQKPESVRETMTPGQERVEALKVYRQELRDAIEESRQALQRNREAKAVSVRQARRWKKRLTQEHRQLGAYIQALSQAVALRSASSGMEEVSLPVPAESSSHVSRQKDLALQARAVREDIKAEKALVDDLKEKAGKAEQEVVRLEKDLKRKEAQVTRQSRGGPKARESDSSARQAEAEFLKKQDEWKAKLARLEKELSDWQEQRGQWEYRAQNEDQAYRVLETERDEKLQAADEYEQVKTDFQQQRRDVIQALKLRKEVLQSSLDVIRDRYETEKVEVEEFMEEKRQLHAYLNVLYEENAGLKEKVSGLTQQQALF